jgi:hypothetical protein
VEEQNDKTLVDALRAAGHDDVAEALKRKTLAGRLEEAGHTDLAEQMAGGSAAAGDEPLSHEEIEAMSREEINERWDEVSSALKQGKAA